MKIIDGKMISSMLKEEYKKKVESLERKPNLVMIRIGDDAAADKDRSGAGVLSAV